MRPAPSHAVAALVALTALLTLVPPAGAQSASTLRPSGIGKRAPPPAWRELTFDKLATHLAFDGDVLWVGTSGGGVYRWDTTTGASKGYSRVNDGLADNLVLDLVVDDGHVWVGTFYGLSRWDGEEWSTFDASNSPLATATALAVGQDGTLWVGTYDQGLFLYDGGSWVNLHPGNSGLSDLFVTSIELGPGGVAWLGVWGDGVDRWDGVTWTNYGAGGGGGSSSDGSGLLSVFAYVKAVNPADGTVWVWCYDDDFDPQVGVNSFDGSSWSTYTTANSGLPSNLVHSIRARPDGTVWFQGSQSVSRLEPGGTWTVFDPIPSTFDTNLARGRSLAFRDDGQLWAGTAEGIARLDGQTFTGMATPGLWDADVNEIAVAADGTLWFATGNGLQSYRRGAWERFTANSPLPHNDVRGVWALPDGGVVVGTFGGAARRDGRGTWTVWTAAGSPLPINQTTPVAHAPDDSLWFGHGLYGSGVSRLEPDGTWTQITESVGGLADDSVWDIEVEAGSGALWFATADGASRFDGTSWLTIGIPQGLINDWVRDIALTPEGDVWMATAGGVAVLSQGTVTAFTSAHGLAEDMTLSVGLDAGGRVWAGSNVSGVSRWDGLSWRVFAQEDGLANNRVRAVTRDALGTLWFGTGYGVGAHRPLGVPWP